MSSPSERTFDYIIVGAGTAGIALAARSVFPSLCPPPCLTKGVHSLSEDPDTTAGVIEAGEFVTDMMSIMVSGKFLLPFTLD